MKPFKAISKNRIEEGRYKNISEVIRAGLRLLEDEEQKYITLRNAIEIQEIKTAQKHTELKYPA